MVTRRHQTAGISEIEAASYEKGTGKFCGDSQKAPSAKGTQPGNAGLMNKKQLSERDICTKYITPALARAGWDVATQVREEYPLTRGRIIVRGKLHTRARHKRADYVLFYKPNIPIAVIEAKDNNHSLGDGMQQALKSELMACLGGKHA